MKHLVAMFVPKLLNFDRKNCCISLAQELFIDVDEGSDLLKRVITGGETWVYGYDIKTKA